MSGEDHTNYQRPLFWAIILLGLVLFVKCEPALTTPETDTANTASKYKTSNVVIVVIDGPRFRETWGDPSKRHIPFFANELAAVGIHHNRFYNCGATYTTSGHAAITTGSYQWMANDGSEIPYYPSIFQLWLKESRMSSSKALVVTSKQKLGVLADCVSPALRGKFNPMVAVADREDRETLSTALELMKQFQPRITLIHFRGPDLYGHANEWSSYLQSIEETDNYSYQIWRFLQQDPFYKDVTTMMVTNDHGRHNNNVRDGFVSHGDFCEGCMHINFFATGPDFHSNLVINKPRQSVDIAPTIAELMGFKHQTFTGSVMWELIK